CRNAARDPDELRAPLVHRERRRHDAAPGVGNAQRLKRAQHDAVNPEAAVQRDEDTCEAVGRELGEIALGRVERMGVDATLAQCLQHGVAGQKRDFAFGRRTAEQHRDLAEAFLTIGHAGSPRTRTSGSSSAPVRACTADCTCSISCSMSAARARRSGLTMKFAWRSETRAPPIAWPLSPHDSMSRAAWSPGGLRNTLPAFGNDSGCVAMRRASSDLISARAVATSPCGKRNHAAVNGASSGEPSRFCTLRYAIA